MSQYLKQAQARVGIVARKWTLDRLLDVGGMAAVYAATHRNGNQVAIKVMHTQYAAMPEAKERFLREGYVANKVGHVDAVTVLDDDELDDGTPFIVMELLLGYSLEARLKEVPALSPAETLYIADAVLDVLADAHNNGIIHRDIKPANLFLLGDAAVKVLDFGLARVLEAPGGMSMTRTGTIIGTTSYMSPEQARGKRDLIDHRTDIFAVGALMFRSLTGRNLNTAKTHVDRLLAAMSEHAPSLAKVLPDMPPDMVALVDKALAFQKTDRWPDAKAMQKELRDVYQRNTGTAIPSSQNAAGVAGWVAAAATPRPVEISGTDDIHVSVMVEEPPTGDSIFVEFEDVDSGEKVRTELRRSADAPAENALDEVSVYIPEE